MADRPGNRDRPTLGARVAGLVLVALLLVVGGYSLWKWWPQRRSSPVAADTPRQPPPEDPRLVFSTPHKNVRPEVRYVGDKACAECHSTQCDSYRDHSMGRSAALMPAAANLDRYESEKHNPFTALGFDYSVEKREGGVVHRETRRDARGRVISDIEAEVAFTLGSGARGRSYIIDRGGYLFQSPVSWFSQKNIWDLSPGFAREHPHFERPVTAGCLYCHVNQVEPVADTHNAFRSPILRGDAIGCERCHGPGELHIARWKREPLQAAERRAALDETIVNPRRLTPGLRDAVCEQCHLQGREQIVRRGRKLFEYRPGLPLHEFVSVFVDPPAFTDNYKAVGHVEQMHASKCFEKSAGKMGCATCHDPHVLPSAETKTAYYRDRCLSCHEVKGCSVPETTRRQKSMNDSCAECHMARFASTDIAHTAISDHRILRSSQDQKPAERRPELLMSELPLVHFHRDLIGDPVGRREVARDLGLAVARRIRSLPSAPLLIMDQGLELVDEALRIDSEDSESWAARASLLLARSRAKEALAACEAGLAKAPQHEALLTTAAHAASQLKQRDLAIAYLQRAVTVNPWLSGYHYDITRLHAEADQWAAATPWCEKALKLNPAHLEARKLLVLCYHEMGRKDEARAQLELLFAFEPPNHEALRSWFAQRLK